MSPTEIALFSTIALLVTAYTAATVTMVVHLGSRIDRLSEHQGGRIDRLGEQLGARIDRLGEQLGGRIDHLGERLDTLSSEVAELRAEFGAHVTTPAEQAHGRSTR